MVLGPEVRLLSFERVAFDRVRRHAFTRGVKDSLDFSVRLLEQSHVAVVPGSAFGTTDHIRISYATSMELDRGLTRIAASMQAFVICVSQIWSTSRNPLLLGRFSSRRIPYGFVARHATRVV